MSWLCFFGIVVAFVFVLYLPGIMLLRGANFSFAESVSLAPLLCIACYALLPIVYSGMGLSCSWVNLFLPVMAIGVMLYLWRRKKESCVNPGDGSILFCKFACLYVALSSMLLLFFFYLKLGSPNYMIQGFDTLFHVNLVRSFLDSGAYNALGASLYLDNQSMALFNDATGSFYPAAWHILIAQIMSMTPDISMEMTVNALNFTLAAVVFPLSVLSFLFSLFKEKKYVCLSGAICVLASFAFPWNLLLRGEQYPLLLSFALSPAVMSLLAYFSISLKGGAGRAAVRYLPLALAGFLALAFSQTSLLFSVFIFAVAFFVGEIYEGDISISKKVGIRRGKNLVCGGIVVLAVLFWIAAYKLPFMRGVVSYQWDAFTVPAQAFVNALSMSFTQSSVSNILLGFLVLVGFFRVLLGGKGKWLLAPYCFAVVAYISAVATEGTIKHVLAGFWYTDPDRLGAMVSLFAIPLEALGLASILSFIAKLLKERGLQFGRCKTSFLLACTLIALFYPNYSLNGVMENVVTQNGFMADRLRSISSTAFVSILDRNELAFSERVGAFVSEDTPIINCPDDGSAFLYGVEGMGMVYRRNYAGSKTETQQSRLIREHLDEYAWNEEVREAVSSIGAGYVLKLRSPESGGANFHTYKSEDWHGVESINAQTDGFRLVMEDGEMELFEIER